MLICVLFLGCAIAQTCTYEGKTYKDGEGFYDGCNNCGCSKGGVVCTQRACPKPQKPGMCPPPPRDGAFGTCSQSCYSDGDCEGASKCCSNGCGMACQAPAPQRGSCPDGSFPMNCFVAPCTTSKCDVEGATCANYYCGGCKAVWTDLAGNRVCQATTTTPKSDVTSPSTPPSTTTPSTKPKSGVCPTVQQGSFGICMSSCSSDSECEGAKKCCSNGCGSSCVDVASVAPTRTCSQVRCRSGNCVDTANGPRCIDACPDGASPVKCFVAPCATSKCDVAGATCSNNYCGGCKAIWTDANGVKVCNGTTTTPKPSEVTAPSTSSLFGKPGSCPAVREGVAGICMSSCSSDSECEGAKKCCSNGCGSSCVDVASVAPTISCSNVRCRSGTRCVNSANGPRCIETCADGSSPVKCFVAPCTTSKCDVAGATCSNHYCGGCKAVWTDANGAKVCNGTTTPKPSEITSPSTTTPSTKPGLCPAVREGVAGICMSSCSSDSDCEGAKKCCSNGCGSSCVTVSSVPATSCRNVRCRSGTRCVNTANGPRCTAIGVATQAETQGQAQALADQQSTFASSSSSGSGAEWAIVGVAALAAIALIAVAVVLLKKLQ